jgi:hypothetical protein
VIRSIDGQAGEETMERTMFGVRSGAGKGWHKASRRRASRPLNRAQEIVVLGVVFALGVGLQLALIIHLAPAAP